MKKSVLHIAVIAALAASPITAQANTTTTITAPTTISQSSLSSSTDLDFDASGSGSPADLTIANGSFAGAQTGGISMTTDGSINYEQGTGDTNSGITLTGDGTAAGTGTLTYSVTPPSGDTNGPDAVLAMQGDDPLAGSLVMTQNGASNTNIAQDMLFVGEGFNSSGVLTPYAGTTTESLQNLDMGNTYALPDVDIGPDASLTVGNASFTVNTQDQAAINLVGNPSSGGGAATDSLAITNLSSDGQIAINIYGNNNDSVDIGTFDVTGTYGGQPASMTIETGGNGPSYATGASTAQTATVTLGGGTAAGGISILDNDSGASTLTANLSGSYSAGDGFEAAGEGTLGQFTLNLNSANISAAGVTIGDAAMNVDGTVNVDASTADVSTSTSDITIGSGDTLNVTGGSGGYSSLSDTINDTGAVNINGGLFAYSDNIKVNPGATFNVTGDLSAQFSTLYFFLNPTQSNPINVSGGNYSLSNDTLVISAAAGTYADGSQYPLITTAGGPVSNSYTPGTVDYVYNGSASSTIDGQQPYVESSSKGLYLCIGSACVPAAPAPTQAPAPAPAPAPIFIPVHIVTAVGEAKPVLADTTTDNIAQARATTDTIIATGVVGGGPRGAWFKGLGGTQSQSGMSGANYGLLTGYGWSVGPDRRDVAGLAFSVGQSAIGTGPQDYASTTDYGLWAYGTYYPTRRVFGHDGWKIVGTIGGGLSSNTIASTALGLPQSASFGGSFMSAELRAGYWQHYGPWIISPRLSVGYDQTWTSSFRTTGGGALDVNAAAGSNGEFYIEPAMLVGKKFNFHTTAGNHVLFPQVRAGLVENVGPAPSLAISSGQVAGQVQGLAYPHTQAMAEVRLDVISHTAYSKGLSGNIAVRQLFGGGASSTEAIAAIKYRW